MSSPRCRLDGPGYSVPSDDIKDMVGAPAIGEAKYYLIPCRVHTRINNLCGTQLFQARNLAWASGSHQHTSAMRHRQLQGEQRDTAASLKQDSFSRPLIVTAGQQTRNLLSYDPYLGVERPTEFPRPYVKWACEPARAEDVPVAIAQAYAIAMEHPWHANYSFPPTDTGLKRTIIEYLRENCYGGILAGEYAYQIPGAMDKSWNSAYQAYLELGEHDRYRPRSLHRGRSLRQHESRSAIL